MLSPATVDELDAYWAGFLGVPRTRLRPPRPIVVPHAELGDYRGMYAQSFGAAPVISLPGELLERFGRQAAEAAAGGLTDGDRWPAVFGERTDVVIGPALVSYADAGCLRAAHLDGVEVRPLAAADRPALDALRDAMTAAEWEHGGGEVDVVFGAFADGVLAARAGYEVWGGRIAHLSVVTHAAHRGRGLGAAVFAFAARAALDAGLIAQHRALVSNTHSLAIARQLGFVPYAASLAVRFRAE